MKKIIFFTGTRADYGLQFPLIKLLRHKFNLEIIICNMHTSAKFGKTLNEIDLNYFKKIYIIKNLPRGQNDSHILKSISNSLVEFEKKISLSKPNIAIILGDRYEMLAAAITCFFLKIPILHINGGEVTTGSLDDGIRNSITSFSDFHCPPTIKSKKKIIKMLNTNKNVINVGALGAHNAFKSIKKSKIYFEKIYKIKFNSKNILITIHPEKNFDNKLIQIKNLLKSLSTFKNVSQIFTASNSDAFGVGINSLISNYCKKNKNAFLIKSFGKEDYLAILKHMSCVVGNSSSGIIEAPILKVPTLNIGLRQDGREFASSIISAPFTSKILSKKLKKILNSKKNKFKYKSSYFKKNTPQEIFNLINKVIY